VRGDLAQQRLALAQGLAHEPDLAVFEVAQPAVNQTRRGRGRPRRDVALVEQQHAQSAHRRVARHPAPVHPRADDDHVEGYAQNVRRDSPHLP
jgi:hypothetical protein